MHVHIRVVCVLCSSYIVLSPCLPLSVPAHLSSSPRLSPLPSRPPPSLPIPPLSSPPPLPVHPSPSLITGLSLPHTLRCLPLPNAVALWRPTLAGARGAGLVDTGDNHLLCGGHAHAHLPSVLHGSPGLECDEQLHVEGGHGQCRDSVRVSKRECVRACVPVGVCVCARARARARVDAWTHKGWADEECDWGL